MPYDREKRMEIPDPKPVAMPIGFERPEPLSSLVRRLVQTHVSEHAANEGMETFEEANDFNTGEDDDEPLTPAERASELGDLMEASREEIREAEENIRTRVRDLEAKRKRLKAERERRESEKIGGEDDEE